VKPLIIHNEARKELDSAVFYYEEQKQSLGLDFLSEVGLALDKIRQNPNLGGVYNVPGVRRYVVSRFPFLIFYTELDDFIWIVAIAHAKRRPDYWSRRLK
jgi:toxin ParE1/3/4